MSLRHYLSVCLLPLVLFTPGYAQQAADAVAPEGDTGTAAFANLSDTAQAALVTKQAGKFVHRPNIMTNKRQFTV